MQTTSISLDSFFPCGARTGNCTVWFKRNNNDGHEISIL